MTEPLIELRGVFKAFGVKPVLHEVDLAVYAGEVVGIIGRNGSGKTTLLRLLAGLMYPDQGTLRIGGATIRPGVTGRMPPDVGVLIESPTFLPQYSGRQNLRLLAGIRRVIGPQDIDEAMSTVGLQPEDRQPVQKYSLGMRQRLGIAQAIMERPQVLLLDEPTNSLDPEGTALLVDHVRRLSAAGHALIIVSHRLDELAPLCHRILQLEDGRLYDHDHLEVGWKIQVKTWGDVERLSQVVPHFEIVHSLDEGPGLVCTGPWRHADDLLAVLQDHGVEALGVEQTNS